MRLDEFAITRAHNLQNAAKQLEKDLADSPKSLMCHLCNMMGQLTLLRDYYALVVDISYPTEIDAAWSTIEKIQDKISL